MAYKGALHEVGLDVQPALCAQPARPRTAPGHQQAIAHGPRGRVCLTVSQTQQIAVSRSPIWNAKLLRPPLLRPSQEYRRVATGSSRSVAFKRKPIKRQPPQHAEIQWFFAQSPLFTPSSSAPAWAASARSLCSDHNGNPLGALGMRPPTILSPKPWRVDLSFALTSMIYGAQK